MVAKARGQEQLQGMTYSRDGEAITTAIRFTSVHAWVIQHKNAYLTSSMIDF
jgi:hypothetical protein